MCLSSVMDARSNVDGSVAGRSGPVARECAYACERACRRPGGRPRIMTSLDGLVAGRELTGMMPAASLQVSSRRCVELARE